jgi:hypothetical protein
LLHLGISPKIPAIGSSTSSNGRPRGVDEGRALLAERLEKRSSEIVRAIVDRLHGMEQDAPVRDVEYLESLADAVHKGVSYGIEVIAVGEARAGEAPLAVTVQARLAARHGIPLATAIQRYLAAKTVLSSFVLEESVGLEPYGPSLLPAALAAQEAAFERLLALAEVEYDQGVRSRPASHEARQVEQARLLLAGERVDAAILEYELGGHHLGLVARSSEARTLVRRLVKEVGCRSLVLAPSSEELWAWLGSTRGPVDSAAVRTWLDANGTPDLPIGMGETKNERSGWGLTYRQAQESVWVAAAKSAPVVAYPEAALLASMARDPVLTTSLQERYLHPLSKARDAETLRNTLRIYFQADGNGTSAASTLGVSRQTVANRIETVEECLGMPLRECREALHAALGLEELGRISVPPDSRS